MNDKERIAEVKETMKEFILAAREIQNNTNDEYEKENKNTNDEYEKEKLTLLYNIYNYVSIHMEIILETFPTSIKLDILCSCRKLVHYINSIIRIGREDIFKLIELRASGNRIANRILTNLTN